MSLESRLSQALRRSAKNAEAIEALQQQVTELQERLDYLEEKDHSSDAGVRLG